VSTDAVFTEVGVVEMTATTATDKFGKGGNAKQSYPTAWSAYLIGAQVIGGQSGACLPYEVACAVTLQTNKRGPSGRGRFYLPPFGINSMAAGGVYITAGIQATLNGCATWLEAIKANTPYVPVVVSPRQLVLNEIVSVDIGKVPDSQRRRRRSQDEARLTHILA
jgi:hypothetical protein